MSDIKSIIGEILVREGWPKYTNLAADRGGPTKGGITIEAWRAHTGNPRATIAQLKAVTEKQARQFYYMRYVKVPRFDRISDEFVRELLIDCGVNHGPGLATRWLQRSIGARPDGQIGPMTIAAFNASEPDSVYLLILGRRIRLYGRLVSGDPKLRAAKRAGFHLQAIFAAGWNNRAAEFIDDMSQRI